MLAENFWLATENLKQTRRQQLHPAQNAIRFMRREGGKSRHHGSPVHEREPFLALQHHRFETGAFQCFFRGKSFAIQTGIASSHQQTRHVRQRDEITTRADRAFAGDFRQHAAIQRREQQLNEFFADAGVATRQSIRPREHDGASFCRREQHALTHGEMIEQIDLMLREVGVRNTKATQRAKASIDAVDGTRLRGE